MSYAVYFLDKDDKPLARRYVNAPVPRVEEIVVLGDSPAKYKVRGVEYSLHQYHQSDVTVDVFVQLEEA